MENGKWKEILCHGLCHGLYHGFALKKDSGDKKYDERWEWDED